MEFTTIWLLICLALTVLGIYFILEGRREIVAGSRVERTWHRTSGTVRELRSIYSRRRRRGASTLPSFMPVVEFTLPDGHVVQAESLTGGRPAPAQVGEVVPLYVDPDDPTRVMVDKGVAGPGRTGTGFMMLGALVLAFALAGVVFLYLLVRVFAIPLG